MVNIIPNSIATEDFEALRQQVLKMNTGIEDFVRNEMLNHKKAYDPDTGIRLTTFESQNGNTYKNTVLVSADGALINCEAVCPINNEKQIDSKAILYIHGAAFQRRSNDINLKTADRLCSMTGAAVYVPDYRVGIDYTYDQMFQDILTCYRYLLHVIPYEARSVTVIADSSGCITALQAIREMQQAQLPAPGKIVLWSPQADEKFDELRINAGKESDIALQTNDLFAIGFNIYRNKMGNGKTCESLFPIYGDYRHLAKETKILIQAGGDELLCSDAYMLHDMFESICPCTLEMYEEMFHNFQTYYSMCDMAKTCWEKVVAFIVNE